jgi:hypothetical protein
MPQTPGVADHAAPEVPIMQRYNKAITAVLGMAATLVAAGVLDDVTEAIVTGILGVATALGVWAVPNKPSKLPPAA